MPLSVLAQAAQPESVCGNADQTNALCEWLLDRTGNEFLARASDIVVVRPAKIVLIALLALVLNALARRGIRRFVRGMQGERLRRRVVSLRERAPDVLLTTGPQATLRTAQRGEAIGALLRSTTTVVIWSIAAVMILGHLGLAVGPLLAGAGVLGVAIGFGSQNLVRDLLSGVFMLVEDQYGVGDVVDLGPATGVVEGISLRTTRIRDVEGIVWHIPNGTINRVGNKSQQWSRALLDISVAYTTDLDVAKDVIKLTAVDLWHDPAWSTKITDEPEVWGVESLGADGVAIRLVVKTLPLAQWEVARELRSRIKEAFDARGIEIPFPQRVVWHRDADQTRARPRRRARS